MMPANPGGHPGIRVLGFDPSMSNWGVAKGTWYPDRPAGQQLVLDGLDVIQTKPSKEKLVRKNCQDLERAAVLAYQARAYARGAQVIFVEVPVGSQSAAAMKSYGICVGILGALRAEGIQFFEVTPDEVKLAATGNKQASKKDMIAWAAWRHKEVQWPQQTKKGVTSIIEGTAEHMADAVGAIYAGVACKAFQQMLSFLQSKAA